MTTQESDIKMNLAAAAEYIGVKKTTMYNLTCQKKIKHFKPGGHRVLFYKSDLDNYLQKNEVPATAA